MTAQIPAFGLLLDVDGPIANPDTRRIDIPSIASDLAMMANAGIPIAFNTGRSLDFIAATVIPPLAEAGLGAGSRVHSIGEKGGTWARIGPEGHGTSHVDPEIALAPVFIARMRALIADRFSSTMFFDETKRTMLSAEMVQGIDYPRYYRDQEAFDAAALAELQALGYGVVHREERHPAGDGSVRVRIDPTVISTDIELVQTGKALGARRALELFSEDGPLPRSWYTVGDSRSDYAMAQWLSEQGYAVTHLDVRPVPPLPRTPYALRVTDGLVNDASAAALFRELASALPTAD